MTQSEKRKYYLQFHSFQQSREKAYAPLFKDAIKKQQQFFINAVSEGVTPQNALLNLPTKRLIEIEKALYTDASRVYAGKVRLSIQQQRTNMQKRRQPIGFNQRMVELITRYFETELLNTVSDITATTRKNIQNVLTQAQYEGWGFDEIVSRIINEELNANRGRMIARTETVTAANQGAMFAAKATGLQLKKEWLSALDNRTREDHIKTNGQVVQFDEPFDVGGYPMQQPGDRTSAPAKEIVNCRCTVIFIPIE